MKGKQFNNQYSLTALFICLSVKSLVYRIYFFHKLPNIELHNAYICNTLVHNMYVMLHVLNIDIHELTQIYINYTLHEPKGAIKVVLMKNQDRKYYLQHVYLNAM